MPSHWAAGSARSTGAGIIREMPLVAAVIALNIRAERHRRRWRQRDLAERMDGWTIGMISEAETGQRKLAIDDLVAFCAALDVPLSKLMEGADMSAFDALGI